MNMTEADEQKIREALEKEADNLTASLKASINDVIAQAKKDSEIIGPVVREIAPQMYHHAAMEAALELALSCVDHNKYPEVAKFAEEHREAVSVLLSSVTRSIISTTLTMAIARCEWAAAMAEAHIKLMGEDHEAPTVMVAPTNDAPPS